MASLPTTFTEPDVALSSTLEPASSVDSEEDEFEPSDFAPSDYDEESVADSESIASSVYGHSYRNGRRYHKARHLVLAPRGGEGASQWTGAALTDAHRNSIAMGGTRYPTTRRSRTGRTCCTP